MKRSYLPKHGVTVAIFCCKRNLVSSKLFLPIFFCCERNLISSKFFDIGPCITICYKNAHVVNGGWFGNLWRGYIDWCVYPCNQSLCLSDQIQKQKLPDGLNLKGANQEKIKLETHFSSIFFLTSNFFLMTHWMVWLLVYWQGNISKAQGKTVQKVGSSWRHQAEVIPSRLQTLPPEELEKFSRDTVTSLVK